MFGMMNLIVNIFYMPFERQKDKGLLFSIWLITWAFGFNFLALMNFVVGYLNFGKQYGVLHIGFLFAAFFYFISNTLERKLITEKKFKKINLPLILYPVGFLYLLISVVVMPLTFRFLGIFS